MSLSDKPNPQPQHFTALGAKRSASAPRRRFGRKLMALAPHRRPLWLALFVHWLALCGIKSLRSTAATMLEEIPRSVLKRPTAVKLTLQAARQHERFRELARQADTLRDHGRFEDAEAAYMQALALFPLHGGYQVQFAHAFKEQQKYVEAFVHYCLALGVGVPTHDVAEHLLFAAKRAGIRARLVDIERLASAWVIAERTLDDWDAPPVESDFDDFARLFWGNVGLVTPLLLQSCLLRCVTRKELFISFLRAPETLRHNPRLFILMKERGLSDV